MLYAKVLDALVVAFPYNFGELRRDNPSVSFPSEIPLETLADFGVYPVSETTAPTVDSFTHRLIQSAEQGPDGLVQVWTAVELPLEQAEANVRARRDRLLSDTDWIVIKAYERQEPTPVEWDVYRQSLRDITAQEGFPYAVIWPPKP